MPEDPIFSRVQEHAVQQLSWAKSRKTNLHVLQDVLREGARVRAYRQTIPIRRNTVMVFADDAPQFNWGHPCRYLLYDARTAEPYEEVPAQFPPYLTKVPENYVAFHEPVRVAYDELIWRLRPRLRCPIRLPRGQRYAVLFSGASNNRHTNDLEFLYRTLRDLYNFRDENIYCLNYDGTINYSGSPQPVVNWPGDSTPYRMPVKGKGTKADLDGVLDELKTRLKAEDFLLIHTNNHGGYDGPGKAYLVTFSGPAYYAADFANKLAQLPPFNTLMVMMEQCHSGGFNAPILAKSPASMTTVASACLEPNNSIGGAQFDPFARDWIAAMTGNDPFGAALAFNPDTSGNGKVSAHEAFNYADAVHDPYDTPIYNESSVAAGQTHLGQRYYYWWWYCPIIVKYLEPHYLRLPIPEFYDRLHRLAPRLEEVARSLDRNSDELRREMEPKLKELVERGF
jgi:hypothetical protein